MDIFDRISLLKAAPMFTQVETEDLQVVARALEEEHYAAGDAVFTIGDNGDHMYIIRSGRVGIALDERGDRGFVAELGPGDCFGEMNLLDELPRSATAQVLEDTVVLTLEKAKLRGLIASYPELSIGMLKGLSLRLREANRRQSQ